VIALTKTISSKLGNDEVRFNALQFISFCSSPTNVHTDTPQRFDRNVIPPEIEALSQQPIREGGDTLNVDENERNFRVLSRLNVELVSQDQCHSLVRHSSRLK
jgi:hypothetical protein